MSTSSKLEENFAYDPLIGDGLPIVMAKYARDEVKSYPSRVAVRSKGSMDTGLWEQLCRDLYLPCYEGKIAPEPLRDPVTHKLLKGPLIIKTDAGPGRLSREAQSITFREEMANKGVFILLSLPNGTACTAELDQMFTQFKDQTKNSTIRVAGLKLAARLAARTKHDGIDNELSSSDEDEDETENKPEKKRSICNVNISNRDLARIVNGFSNDPIELRPFDNCFTESKIIKTWIAVGFCL